MPNESTIIPYKVQKGNRPNIDKIIENCIYGEIQENARNFIAWLKANGITFQKHASTTRQHYASYKNKRLLQIGFWDERIDFNHVVNHYEGGPQYWGFSLLVAASDYNGLVDDCEMAAIEWAFPKCGRCKPGAICIGIVDGAAKGVTQTFFGREYDGLCKHARLEIKNPGNAAIESIKKLILLAMRGMDDER